jgi:hypothetical protein
MDRTRVTAARVMDLRSGFEAQLRAVTRLEEQLRKASGGNAHDLAKAVRRELAEMLANNASIRNVLTELATDIGTAVET